MKQRASLLTRVAPGIAIVLLVLLAYVPAMSAGFIWDDNDYVTQNLALRSFEGLHRIWSRIGQVPQYYPLTHSTFWIEHHLWGNQPAGYHLVNILIHSISSIVLWRLLIRLEIPGAALAAMLFAIHPVHVESVAWITERKNVLSGLFYLLAFAVYWSAIGSPDEQRPPRLSWPLYLAALGLFLLALLAKTVASSLPAAILLVLWYKRGKLTWRDALALMPMFIIGASLGALTSWMERHIVGAYGPDWDLSFLQRLLIASRAIWFYAEKLLLPVNLTFIYPRWKINPGDWTAWIFPIAATAVVALAMALRRRIGRGPLVAALFFAGTLFPALGFVNTFPMLYSFVADHFQYLASIGLFVLAAATLTRYLPRNTLYVVAGIWLACLLALTFHQARVYKDLPTLWTDTIQKNPHAWMAGSNLAGIYLDEAEKLSPDQRGPLLSKATTLLNQALADKPDGLNSMLNLGKARDLVGDEQGALAIWQSVMDYRQRVNPQAWEFPAANAQFAIGQVYQKRGELDPAALHFEKAIEIFPVHTKAMTQLAVVETARGNLDKAYSLLQSEMKYEPDSPTLWTNLGNLLFKAGELSGARSAYAKAIELHPGHFPAQYSLAMVEAQSGNFDAAERMLRELLRDHADSPDVLASLGTICAKTGRKDEARQLFMAALQISPNHPQATRQLQQLQ